MMKNSFNRQLIALLSLGITACSSHTTTAGGDSLFRNKALDYTQSKSIQRLTVSDSLDSEKLQKDLLIIPDVSAVNGTAGITDAPRPTFTFAELSSENVQIKGANDEKYLVVKAPYDLVWGKLQTYLKLRQKAQVVADETTGVMETEWTPLDGVNTNPNLVDKFLRDVTGGDKAIAFSKTRFQLTKPIDASKPRKVQIYLDYAEASHQQVAADKPVDWQNQQHFLEQQRTLLFDLVRFLNQSVVTATLEKGPVNPKVFYGLTHGGEPVLRVEARQDKAMALLLQAMDAMDVGSFDVDKGRIYFTHTSQLRAAKPEVEGEGFWGWFKGLHGSGDSGPIVLSKSADTQRQDAQQQENPIVYSKLGIQPSASAELADKKGHKVWLGGKVIFVFEDEDQGNIDEKGNYVFTDNYQLRLTPSLNGVYVQVVDSLGKQPATVYTEEILAQIIDGL